MRKVSGERLEQVPAYNAMWFAWATYWPGTPVASGAYLYRLEMPDAGFGETGAMTLMR